MHLVAPLQIKTLAWFRYTFQFIVFSSTIYITLESLDNTHDHTIYHYMFIIINNCPPKLTLLDLLYVINLRANLLAVIRLKREETERVVGKGRGKAQKKEKNIRIQR